MNRKNKIAIIIVLSLLAVFCFFQTDLLAADPMIAVEGSGMPGKALKISGSNFVPGEVIQLVLEMDDVPIIVGKKGKIITVKENGTFNAETNYPHKLVAVPGAWDLYATGDKGSKVSCKVEIKKP
jgi:hypothetical protein